MIYAFNNFSINSKNFIIEQDGKEVEVEPRVFDVIIYLLENKSKVVTREELFEVVWKGRDVIDATLSNHIKMARSILGDDGQAQKVIKTVHGRGYQFIATIQNISDQQKNQGPFIRTANKKYLIYTALVAIISIVTLLILNKPNDKVVDKQSIAVLAFLDLSPNQDHEYFSEGMSEEILNKLTQIPELRVISRTSSFYFKDKGLTATQIGKQLNVTHILEGSVRKHKNQLRITVQLIEIKTAQHIWSQTYDKKLDDVFQIQDDIAHAVSKKLKLSLLPDTKNINVVNLDAYSEYLKAIYLRQTNTRTNNRDSELIIRKSIALDPNYAPAWHFLAVNVFTFNYDYGIRSIKTRTKTALFAVKKAIELDPNHAQSYAILARIQTLNLQFELAEKSINKALTLNNKNSYVLDIAAQNAVFAGNIVLAKEYRKKILDIDPKYYRNIYSIAQIDLIALDLDAAIENFQLFIKYKPENAVTRHLLSSALILQGKYTQALKYANEEKDGFWKDYSLCMALYAAGEIEQANILLEKFIIERHYSRANIARIYASRGETEKSLEWLDAAIKHNDSSLIEWLNFPEFRKIHDDPRWHKIILQMEFPKSHWLVQQMTQ